MSALARFRAAVLRKLGLTFDEGRDAQLEELVQRRSAAAGLTDEAWVARVEAAGSPELRAAVPELTVGETSFFRHLEVLRAFTDQALPAPVPRQRRRVRVLSAGCSTGEEPGTLAILLRTHAPDADVTLKAIDLNPASLEHARAGRYSEWALRDTPPDVRQRWFRSDRGQYVLDPDLRRTIDYEERNLVDEDPVLWAPSSWDVVFCRNVLMYLHPDVQRAVVRRIARAMAPGGCLFLGHAETLRGLSNDFHLRQSAGAFWYQRRGTHEPAAPALRPSAAPAAVGAGGGWMQEILAASERVRTLSARQPDSPVASPSPPRDPDRALLQAAQTTERGDREEAERLCREILEQDELNAGAHYLMALCRERAGDLEGAVAHDRYATHLDAGFAMPWLHQGIVARRRGDWNVAREALTRALALLEREDPARILLFGGGFARDALIAICRGELRSCAS